MRRHRPRASLAIRSAGVRSALLLLAGLVFAACDGDAPAPPSGGGGGSDTPGQVVTLRGGERMGWDQEAPSAQAIRVYTFRLYVDGVAAGLTDTRCSDTRSSAGYECSGRLPAMAAGRHTLELTANANGLESARSAGLSVLVATAQTPGTATSESASTSPADSGVEVICVSALDADCYDSRLIAAGLGPVTAVVPTTDRQVLVIEDARAVRVIQDGRLVDTPALTFAGDDARVIGLAVPPDFERSHFAYVAWSESSRSGRRELNVTRYRELLGVLAEGATVVSGVPIPADGAAPLAFDDEGFLYVGVPALAAGDAAARRASFNESVLRFAPDGSVPPSNPQASPVIAQGYARPSALVWDRAGRRLWLAGDDVKWPGPIATLAAPADPRTRRSWSSLGVSLEGERPASSPAPRLALTTAPPPASSGYVWLVPATGMVLRAPVQPDQRTLRFTSVELGAIRNTRMVVEGLGASLLVVSADGSSNGSTEIWRLTPSSSQALRVFKPGR